MGIITQSWPRAWEAARGMVMRGMAHKSALRDGETPGVLDLRTAGLTVCGASPGETERYADRARRVALDPREENV